jgi:uncharacterized NAD(P)/FAD-binding protein YdhS
MTSPAITVRSLLVAAPGDTAAHLFDARPARAVTFQTPANAGTVTILGVGGTTPDADGIVLAASTTWSLPANHAIRDLSQLAYRMSNGADTLRVLFTA